MLALTGDLQGKLMFEQQPMKMAAAEAPARRQPASSPSSRRQRRLEQLRRTSSSIPIPGLLSFLANGDFTTEVKGVNELIPEYKAKYGTNYPDDPGSASGPARRSTTCRSWRSPTGASG